MKKNIVDAFIRHFGDSDEGCYVDGVWFSPKSVIEFLSERIYEGKSNVRSVRLYEQAERVELFMPDASIMTVDDFKNEIDRRYPDEESVREIPIDELESYRHKKYGIVKIIERGEEVFISLGDRGLAGYYSLREAKEELVFAYERSPEYRMAEAQREEQEEIENDRKVKESYRGFLDGKTPMQVGRIRKTLEEVKVRNRIGKPVSYKDLIDEYAKDGVLEITYDRLVSGNKKWFLSMKGSTKGYYVGKIVAEYAEYILNLAES